MQRDRESSNWALIDMSELSWCRLLNTPQRNLFLQLILSLLGGHGDEVHIIFLPGDQSPILSLCSIHACLLFYELCLLFYEFQSTHLLEREKSSYIRVCLIII